VTGAGGAHEAREEPAGERLNRGIANAVVREHKRFLGRGPARAQAFMTSHHIEPDLDVAMFVLDRPVPAEPPPGTGR
jgi:hypothetical protein